MAENKPDPNTRSADYLAMEPYWQMVADLLDGTPAMRRAGAKYLPKFPAERAEDHAYRVKTSKYVNIFADIMENLAAKPFARDVAVIENTATSKILALAEDIDGRGNSLHVFAQELFFHGLNAAVGWIFVDYPRVPPNLTLDDERRLGVRPYWVHVHARDVVAVETASIDGREQFVHARILETSRERDGFGEKTVNRVRVLDRAKLEDGSYGPATWELFEERKSGDYGPAEWVLIDSGLISIGVIALVPFIAGRRKAGSWQFIPPMQGAAHLQVEHYQAESALKSIKELCCFPMLSASGMKPPEDGGSIGVGPRTVLYAPTDGDGNPGSWSFVEPSATSMQFLADNIDTLEQQLRELGRQPLTAQTGNLTVVSTAFAASKANSVISAWALNLKDALEQALNLTALWLGETAEPEVSIDTEFDVPLGEDHGPENLLNMRAAGDLSQETLWREYKRRGLLSAEFDPAKEVERLMDEIPGDDDEGRFAAVMPFRNQA